MFLLTLLVAVVMSWLTVTIQDQRKQKAAADAIEQLGGKVGTEPTWLGKLLRDESLVRVSCGPCREAHHRCWAGVSPRIEPTPFGMAR